MGKSNTELLKIAQKYLGYGGSKFRKFCGLPSGAAWCNAYVDTIAAEGGDAELYFDGKKMTYCPTSVKWCDKNLAQIPIYLALPMDIIYFDWEPNGVPNHIGFVRERKSDQEVYTIEGNTSGSRVAQKVRTVKYVCGCYRPAFPATFDTSKALVIDGYFGYNSIACLQVALKKLGLYTMDIDGILGRGTVKALQKKVGVTQDGSWGPATSRAVQKLVGAKVDGAFGPSSTKKLQEWINKQNGKTSTSTKSTTAKTAKTKGDKIAATAKSLIGKVKYVSGGTNIKTGVDCTGFVQHCYKVNGITLDNKLSSWGKSIGKDASKAKPGDIFTYKNKTGIHHAIYVGSGMVVHAANKKEGVKKSKWNSMSRPLTGIRRRWK